MAFLTAHIDASVSSWSDARQRVFRASRPPSTLASKRDQMGYSFPSGGELRHLDHDAQPLVPRARDRRVLNARGEEGIGLTLSLLEAAVSVS